MKSRVPITISALVAVLLFTIPATSASTQHMTGDGVQVIRLSETGHERANSVAYSPDGEWLAVGTTSGIFIFDTGTYDRERFIEAGSWVRSLAFSADGRYLAAGLFDSTARLWRFPDGEQEKIFKGAEGWVRSVALSPDGRLMATASDDHTVRVWNTGDGSILSRIEDLGGTRVLVLSPDGRTLAIGLQDNSIQLRRVPEGDLLRTLSGHTGWVRSLAFSADGRTLASGAFDATARLWDVETGQLLHSLYGHQSSVLGVAFAPDGTVLATGSVDRTVRLWQVEDGSHKQTFVGHTDFVYSLAFSPDGKTLASGSQDNTVRVWDLEDGPSSPPDVRSTPSDCRACHHPMSNTSPPAVIEVRCDACHVNGIGLNWCPYFTRSPGTAPLPEVLPVIGEMAGVPVPNRSLDVFIFSPSNGETLYSYAEYVAPITVSGRVSGPGVSLDETDVRLEVWSGAGMLSSLIQRPQTNGSFEFLLGANPDGHMLFINDPAAPLTCSACHDDFNVQAYLPSGDYRLVVTATAPDGAQAVDERWITVDVSRSAALEVIVRDAGSGEPVSGLAVQAVTRLYDWRGRTVSAGSNEKGSALLDLETLSQAVTEYTIVVPDQVVDGVFYSSQEPGRIVFTQEQEDIAPVRLSVHSTRGTIDGGLAESEKNVPEPVKVWAFSLPVGPAFQTEPSADGSFTFTELPVSRYLVYPDPDEALRQHRVGSQEYVDLTRSPSGSALLDLQSIRGLVLEGKVSGIEGEWLPFAWLISQDGQAVQADLETGSWVAGGVPAEGQSWVVNAPGFYSQEIHLSSETAHEIVLLERSEYTDRIPWGDGEIMIPRETVAASGERQVSFEYGWIWGSGRDTKPIVIETADVEISLSAGRFALQGLPGEIAWLILFEGQAELFSKKTGEGKTLQAGRMIAVLQNDRLVDMAYGPAQRIALGTASGSPLLSAWKPGVFERVQNKLSEAGIGTAQLVTFITYIIAISSLGIVPLVILTWWLKRRKIHGEKNE